MYRGLSTEYFSFIPAFEALGHEVLHFDSWDKNLYLDYADLNSKLLSFVDEICPDIIFAVTLGYEIWVETWGVVKQKSSCRLVHWCTDDSWKFREHSRFIAPYFDLMVTTYEEFLPAYADIGSSAFLSGWGCPVQWLSEPKQAALCKYSVTFVGSAHGNRKELVAKLKELGVNVECFGYGWKNGAVDAEDIPNIFRSSIISLNFANSKGENQIKARTFEVPGSGGFLVSDDAKSLSSVFRDKQEIIIVKNIEETVEVVKYYLENCKLRDEIANNGFLKVKNKYSYANRVDDILGYALSIERKKSNMDIPDFVVLKGAHRMNVCLRLFRAVLIGVGKIVFGKTRGVRFARRASFELEWRIRGAKTYTHLGWTSRMFYGI